MIDTIDKKITHCIIGSGKKNCKFCENLSEAIVKMRRNISYKFFKDFQRSL